jgi:ribosomal protein L24
MFRSWKEVIALPAFQALSPDQQEQARLAYFERVVAPGLTPQTDLDQAWAEFDVETAPRTERTWGEALADTGLQLAEGGLNIVGAPVSLLAPESDLAAGFQGAGDWLRQQQSLVLRDKIQAADAAVQAAGEEGFLPQLWTGLKEYGTAPALAARLMATTLPSFVPVLGAAKLAQVGTLSRGLASGLAREEAARRAATAGLAAASATNAALNAGGARQEAYADIRQTLIDQGMDPLVAEQIAMEDSRLPAAVGGLAGAVGGRLGIEPAFAGKALGQGGWRAGGAALGAELGGEQIEELSPQATTNLMAGQYDQRDITQNLGQTAAQTLIGSAPGGVVAGYMGKRGDGTAEGTVPPGTPPGTPSGTPTGDVPPAAPPAPPPGTAPITPPVPPAPPSGTLERAAVAGATVEGAGLGTTPQPSPEELAQAQAQAVQQQQQAAQQAAQEQQKAQQEALKEQERQAMAAEKLRQAQLKTRQVEIATLSKLGLPLPDAGLTTLGTEPGAFDWRQQLNPPTPTNEVTANGQEAMPGPGQAPNAPPSAAVVTQPVTAPELAVTRTSSGKSVEQLLEEAKASIAARKQFVIDNADRPFSAPTKAGYETVMVTPSAKNPGKWQVTYFDERGPSSDSQASSYADAVKLAHQYGIDWNKVSLEDQIPAVTGQPISQATGQAEAGAVESIAPSVQRVPTTGGIVTPDEELKIIELLRGKAKSGALSYLRGGFQVDKRLDVYEKLKQGGHIQALWEEANPTTPPQVQRQRLDLAGLGLPNPDAGLGTTGERKPVSDLPARRRLLAGLTAAGLPSADAGLATRGQGEGAPVLRGTAPVQAPTPVATTPEVHIDPATGENNPVTSAETQQAVLQSTATPKTILAYVEQQVAGFKAKVEQRRKELRAEHPKDLYKDETIARVAEQDVRDGMNGLMTIDVPGDGRFKVKATTERLDWFVRQMKQATTAATRKARRASPAGVSGSTVQSFLKDLEATNNPADYENAIAIREMRGLPTDGMADTLAKKQAAWDARERNAAGQRIPIVGDRVLVTEGKDKGNEGVVKADKHGTKKVAYDDINAEVYLHNLTVQVIGDDEVKAEADKPAQVEPAQTPSATKPEAKAEAKAISQEEPSEERLQEVGLLRKWGDRWQYRMRPQGTWYHANSKEGAIEMARKTYAETPENQRLNSAQQFEVDVANELADMDRIYGKTSLAELRKMHADMGGDVASLQNVGRPEREMSGGGRRTGPAVAAQRAREIAEDRRRLGRYIEERAKREAKPQPKPDAATETAERPAGKATPVENFGEALDQAQVLDTGVAFSQVTTQGVPLTPEERRNLVRSPSFLEKLTNLLKVPVGSKPALTSANLVDGKPASGKGRLNSMRTHAKFLSDMLNKMSLSDQSFSSLDAKTQRLMLSHMLSLANDPQVFNAIIELIPVDVMDNLVAAQATPQVLFHDGAVLKKALSQELSLVVPLRGDMSDALIRAVALGGAEVSSGTVGLNLKGPAANTFAASGAGDGNHGNDNTRQDRVSQLSTSLQEEANGNVALYSKAGPKAQMEGNPITPQSARTRLDNLLGAKVAKILLDSGVLQLTNRGDQFQGATYRNGRMVLNLDALTDATFDGVLAHEGFHGTVRDLLGDETYTQLMQRLDGLLKADTGWVQQAKARVPDDTQGRHVTEEIGAYAVEDALNGAKQPGVLQRWAQSFLSALRAAIIRHLPNGRLKNWALANLQAQDLARLAIAGLRARARTGGVGMNAALAGANGRYSFAGRKAKTADRHALSTAQDRLAKGEDPEQVRQDTGWHLGKDGKWRFEIDDAQARLKPLRDGIDGFQYNNDTLENIIDHPALFAAYPKLRNLLTGIEVDPSLKESSGVYREGTAGDKYTFGREPEINVKANTADKALSTLLHEIQHGIQHIEGFALGSNPRAAKLRPEFKQLVNETKQKSAKAGWDSISTATDDEANNEALLADIVYRRHYGETEARNTQARQTMNAEARRLVPPSMTQDVADADVIVVFNGDVMENAPRPANAMAEPTSLPPTLMVDGIELPTQNTGAFNPEDPDIRYSRASDWINRIRGGSTTPPTSPFHTSNESIRTANKTLWDKAKSDLKRMLAPGGNLPRPVFQLKIERDSQFEAAEMDVRNLLAHFEQAVTSAYGKRYNLLSEDDKALLGEALRFNTEAAMDQRIPAAVRAEVLKMRQYIDRLSEDYVGILFEEATDLLASGKVEQAAQRASLLQTIADNIGEYVHRSYRAFDDPKWVNKVPDAVLDDARAYITARREAKALKYDQWAANADAAGESDKADRHRARAERYRDPARVDKTIRLILTEGTAFDSMESFIKEAKLGQMDLSILKRRKDIAPEIRALLGEYTDPRLNFTKSATKMSRLIWNNRFLKRVLEIGEGQFLFKDKEDAPMEMTKKIAASKAYAPLEGYYTSPEIEQAFVDALGNENMADWYRAVVQANGLIKFGKTVLSPTTALRNWMSGYFFTLANGHFDASPMRTAFKAWHEYRTDQDRGRFFSYLRELKTLGVVYDTPYAEEMMRLIDDASLENRFSPEQWTTVKNALDVAKKFYSFGDDFWKIVGYENEKALLMKHKGMTEEEAKVAAAERIRNTYPTYSMTGRFINQLRRFPLAGTFVSFPAEIIRTTANILHYLHQDMKDPALRPLAIRRGVGMAMASGMTFAAQAVFMALLGVDDDEEEAFRKLAAPWQKNSQLLPVGRDENGNLRFIDLSFLDPYNYFKRTIVAIMRDQPYSDALKSAARDAFTPFFGMDIAAGAIYDVLRNAKDPGGKVFNPQDSVVQQTGDILNHLRKSLQPGVATNLERAIKAAQGEVSPSGQQYSLGDEALANLGFRVSTFNPRTALYFKAFEFTTSKSDANQILLRVLRDPNEVDQEDIATAFRRASRARSKVYADMQTLVSGAMASGLSRSQVLTTLRKSGVSEKDAMALLRGKVPRWVPTPDFMVSAIRKADAIYSPKTRTEFMRRRQQIFSLMQGAQ